jgi:aminoglycoside phosphotransferase (APT) family kinase protein
LTYPAGPEFITPEWLNRHCDLGGEVESVSSTTIGEGVGMLGVLGRLQLTYNRGSGPASVIAKLASPHDQVLDLVQTFGFYEREINFYKHTRDTIANIPSIYHAEVDASGRAFALVLEDLSDCRTPDQVAGCSAADAMKVMDSVAELHAHHWNIDRMPKFDWLTRANEGAYRGAESQFNMVYEPFLATYGDRLSDTGRTVASELRTKTLRIADEGVERGPLTLVHMDMRLDNVLFNDAAADPGTASSPVYFIDWQLCTKAPGAQDVAYFLAWSMDDATRRAETPALLKRYYESLVAAGVVGYSYADFETDVRRSLLTCGMMAAVASIAITTTNQRGRDLMDAYVLRTFTTIDDMNAYETLPA